MPVEPLPSTEPRSAEEPQPARRGLLVPVLALVLALALGSFLRLEGLGEAAMSPDEGSYLQSALIHELDRDSPPAAWPGEDLAWAQGPKAYPHSYLHQWVARQLHRAGASHKLAIRLGSVAAGLLTALALALASWRLFPRSPWTAALTGALVALSSLQVFYARTGWGTTSSSLWILVAMALGWRLLHTGTPRGRILSGLGLTLASLAAYGFHEMASVYVVGLGLAMVAVELHDRGRGAWRSPALWTWATASIPVGLATIWILLFSDFAQEHWFDTVRGEVGYFEARGTILRFLFLSEGGLPLLLGPHLLLLALVGLGVLSRREPRLALFLGANLVAAFLLFLAFFQDTNLIRIHLPGACLVLVLAAQGLAWLATRAGRAAPLASGLVVVLLLGEAQASRATAVGVPGDALFRSAYFATNQGESKGDQLRREEVVVAYLRDHLAPGDVVRTVGFTPKFFLADAGIPAEGFHRRPSRFVVGRRAATTNRLSQASDRGRYREVSLDGDGFWILFERIPTPGDRP